MIQIRNLHKKFDSLEVLKGVSLEVPQGEVVALIGSSGTGKSTLLRCINYLEPPDSGEIDMDGSTIDYVGITGKQIHYLRQNTSMVFQNYNLFRNKTALQNVMEHLLIVKKLKKKDAQEQALALLNKVGLADKKDSYPSKMSGGQLQRVAIARAMAVSPKVMLLDEPTSALDPELVGEVLDVIKRLASEHMTMVIVTHEMKFAREAANKVVFMDEGVIVEQGPPDKFFISPQQERTQKFLARLTH